MKKYSYLTIGKRLKELRKNLKLSQKKFATKIDIYWRTYQNYEYGESLPPEPVLERVAGLCNTTVSWILGRGLVSNVEPALLKKSRSIPVISWVRAGEWTETCDTIRPEDAEDWIQSDVPGECVFALRVKGDSMEDQFSDGDIIIVNPHIQPEIGDYVIVKNHKEEATFKQLKKYGDRYILRPLNQRYPEMEVKEGEFRIIGVVVEKRRKFR